MTAPAEWAMMGIVRDEDLVQTFAGETPSAVRAGWPPDPALAAALRDLLVRARDAWPGITVDDAALLTFVRERLPGQRGLLDELGALHADGMYLACACAARDPLAMEVFEAALWPEVGRALSQMGIESALADEILSRLREVVFFGDAGGAAPLITSYAGRGALRSWVRSIAIHQALKLRRKSKPMVPLDQLVVELPAQQTDPEMAYLRSFYLAEFRLALGRGMRSLPRRERNLLRQHYLDKMSLEAIAKAYRVHRATAARWLAEARDTVLARTKAELVAAIDLQPSELESVMSFVRHQSTFGGHMSEIGHVLRKS